MSKGKLCHCGRPVEEGTFGWRHISFGKCGSPAFERKRMKCVVCGEDQTDVEFKLLLELENVSVGFPICDRHQVRDLTPGQYVFDFDQLIVEVI